MPSTKFYTSYTALRCRLFQTIEEFRKTKVGNKEPVISKDIFPQLLSQLVKELEEGNVKANLIKGFKKCRIAPIDVTPLL